MKHARPMWLAFALAVVAVFAAMGWITATVLRLDTAEADSRKRAQLEENVRLALWRMDSALAPLIAAEHARPVGAYRVSAVRPGKHVGDVPAEFVAQHPIDPPVLPGGEKTFVRLYFQFDAAGRLTTPQAPPSAPQPAQLPSRRAFAAELEMLKQLAPANVLLASLPQASPLADVPNEVLGNGPGQQYALNDNNNDLPQQQAGVANAPPAVQQQFRNRQEFNARAQNSANQIQVQSLNNYQAIGEPMSGPVVMQPIWSGEQLLLARRITGTDGDWIQGCWLDWPLLRSWLLTSCTDLLPGAKLEPIAKDATADPDVRLLASLPVRLVPGAPPSSVTDRTSPLRLSLVIAWAFALLACGAVAVLLRGVVSLSERRGAFVSAVTHELRTPLTTLRMYTEMLEGGMVTDAGQQKHYLGTMRAEADRLGHLVENVLAYSRLERHREGGADRVTLKVGDLLPRIAERLSERVRQGGMSLDVKVDPAAAAAVVRTNPVSLEQILFNLVDNACKYAGSAKQPMIHLTAMLTNGSVRLRVTDHGPGIAAGRAGKLFKPFSKTSQEAANSAPGLGLGLALSQRLARAMGCDLRLEGSDENGTSFVLSVPAEN